MGAETDVTRLLLSANGGDHEALNRLLPIMYDQLRTVAHGRLRSERQNHTLNTTALVHEAYLKLVDVNHVKWVDRVHFLAMASRVMRRILIDYAVARRALKRGGHFEKVDLDADLFMSDEVAESFLDLDEALKQLEAVNYRASQVTAHRYFGGLTTEELAEALGLSARTVERDLRFARAWLSRHLSGVAVTS